MFLSQTERYGNRVLYRFAEDGNWQSYTWNQALSLVRELALGLVSLGIQRGDRVAIFSSNRVEWNLVDWANICIGALTVPIYASSTPSQALHVVGHAEPTIFFVESMQRLKKIELLHPSLSRVKSIILIEAGEQIFPPVGDKTVLSLGELQERGRLYRKDHQELFERLAHSLRPEDNLTVIYTSGTTGEPKGVLTTHAQYLHVIDAVDAAIPSTDRDVTLHFLPSAHSFGRLEHFMAIAKGYTLGYARSVETVAKDLRIIRPTILFSVPRMYENAFRRIWSRVERAAAPRRWMFHWAAAVGKHYSRSVRKRRRAPWGLRLARELADRLVFSKIRSALGGGLRLAISGGAPLAPEIAEFFHALGVLILEGYGLTETATVSHVNRPEHYKFGTVGLPLKGVQCRIAPDGEILLRGPNIFKGYYRDLMATEEAIDAEGWFHTGDMGEIDKDGFLTVTDRKKDLIVTSGGKKVAPQRIENLLQRDPLISQVMVVGDRQRHLLALISLNQEPIIEQAARKGLKFSSPEEMVSHPWVVSLIRERVQKKNKELAPFEKVRNFCLLAHDLTVEKEELTPTLKLRRHVVMERYKGLIEEMEYKL
jgi:long-chain acyl-CoA synthetase